MGPNRRHGSLWGPSPVALNNILSLTHRLHAVCCGYKRQQEKNMSALAREQGVCKALAADVTVNRSYG